MTVMYDKLEEMRVFSQLSGSCHYVDIEDINFACIGGVALPYTLAVDMIKWVMTGSRPPSVFLSDTVQRELVVKINPYILILVTGSTGLIGWYIHNILQKVMQQWNVKDFDCIMASL